MRKETKTLVGVKELINFGATLLNISSEEAENILREDYMFPDGIELRECDYGNLEYEFDSEDWSEDTKKIMFGFREKNSIKKFTLSWDE